MKKKKQARWDFTGGRMFMSCLRVLSREFCENQPDSRGLGGTDQWGIGGTTRGWPFPCWHWSSPLRILIYCLTTWCEEPAHCKRPWSWERLKAGGEGDDRGWDGWMASPTSWLEFEQAPGDGEGLGSLAYCSQCSQRVGDDWVAEQPHCGCFTVAAYRLSTHGCFM